MKPLFWGLLLHEMEENQKEQKPTCGFKIAPEFKQELENFLNDRPYAESDFFLRTMFEIEEKDPFYTEEAIDRLVNYISTCPRRIAKPLLEKFTMNEHLGKFTFQPKEQNAD